jgi:hypothetical protein
MNARPTLSNGKTVKGNGCRMECVLLRFNDNLFALNHLFIISNIIIFLLKSFIFEWECKMLVLSGKIIGVEILFNILGMYVCMYIVGEGLNRP